MKIKKPAQKKRTPMVCCDSTAAGPEHGPSDSELCLWSRRPDAHSAGILDCRQHLNYN